MRIYIKHTKRVVTHGLFELKSRKKGEKGEKERGGRGAVLRRKIGRKCLPGESGGDSAVGRDFPSAAGTYPWINTIFAYPTAWRYSLSLSPLPSRRMPIKARLGQEEGGSAVAK